MPQEPLCQTSTRPEHSVSPPLSRSFSLSEKAAALPVTALVGGRSPWEPQGRGLTYLCRGQQLDSSWVFFLKKQRWEALDQGQLGEVLSPYMSV